MLAIDERLRYLIPFRPPSEIATYVHELRSAGHELAVFADDGEKFGGWPGTREWVYDKGWLRDFLDTMEKLIAKGEIVLSTGSDALDAVRSGGIAYLPTASYREMEGWSLPATAALKLAELENEEHSNVVHSRLALEEFPCEVSGVEPRPQEDARSLRALPSPWRSTTKRGAPLDARSATTPHGMECSADSTCRTCARRYG